MRCIRPFNQLKVGQVPCGACHACRINRREDWAVRLFHESKMFDDNVFTTLTYDTENLPKNSSLNKRDVQLFLKRFRKKVSPRKIRYFACGEYGGKFNRPHYHAIMFDVGLDDKKDIKKCWSKGIIDVKPINKERLRYCAKYINKKITGKKAQHHYGKKVPEFSLMSKRPPLGLKYIGKYVETWKNKGYVSFYGKKVPVPKLYKKKYYTEDDMIKMRDIVVEQAVKRNKKMVQRTLQNNQNLVENIQDEVKTRVKNISKGKESL